jgi:hypothetical protein
MDNDEYGDDKDKYKQVSTVLQESCHGTVLELLVQMLFPYNCINICCGQQCILVPKSK